jgi:DNA-binding transcriptional MerR regulator
VRISELSRASGISIPTIKYYLREGLLPPGSPTAPNQATYSERHLRRLRLIGMLSDIGGMSLRAARAVLDAIDDERVGMHELLGVAHHALGPSPDAHDPAPDVLEARAEVDRFLADLGWHVGRGAPARWSLARALVTLRRLGRDADAKVFAPYARAVDRLAAKEVATVVPTSRAEAVEGVVVGTVVFETALVALRRLAQEHHSAQRSWKEPHDGKIAARTGARSAPRAR